MNKNPPKISITFCGLEFSNPFILASGPPARNAEMLLRAFEQGWAGAVTKTISFKPTQSPKPRLSIINNTKSLVNIELISPHSVKEWVKWIRIIKKEAPEQILIASIMASIKTREWQELAKIISDAGADALELNISCPHGMPEKGMGSLIGQAPELSARITSAVKKATFLPVIVKLTPNVTDITVIARACARSGADALSGINTVKSLAGINIETRLPEPPINTKGTFGGYAGRGIKPIALRCIAEMYRATKLPISGGGGIFTWEDAVEFLSVGARTLQLCSAVMLSGYSIIQHLKKGLKQYLVKHHFGSVEEIVGSSQKYLTRHSSLRSKPLCASIKQDKCLRSHNEVPVGRGCNKCYIVCRDSGFQAVISTKGRYKISEKLCDGCGLCIHLCPNNAINLSHIRHPQWDRRKRSKPISVK
jgi:dihydropyrimidine dehydrogenase (NAD+) subunit PreA